MIGSLISPYPLESTTNADLQRLTQTLWDWDICDICKNGEACTTSKCSWSRSVRLKRFFDFYKSITSFYVPDLLPGSTPALRNHDDMFEIVRLLRVHPNMKRSELTEKYFSERDKFPPVNDQHRAFNLAIQVMMMVTCSAEKQPSGLLELGIQPVQWNSDTSLIEFLSKAFPQTDTGNLYIRDDSGKIRDVKSAIPARRLKKVAGLRFHGTDDLRNHLRMDVKKGIVEIYHHTSVLTEHLMASKALHEGEAPVSSGNFPRQIALEALDSVQKVLFPFGSDSEQVLLNLVSEQSFDPDCLRYDSAACRREDEEDISYKYFGGRLVDLYEELQDPSPRGILEKWLQRKSGARYVMMATLVGVIIAVLLGILGLAVGIFQAWVAYEAWKYPASTAN
ncbi:hypothetical protein BGZ63DRAFT_361417 [Mariannaea sp. PMI_226]|nr:hypothetical protein BGZ63DRAFT_361417 [Mariannaea sp. PMI_226]